MCDCNGTITYTDETTTINRGFHMLVLGRRVVGGILSLLISNGIEVHKKAKLLSRSEPSIFLKVTCVTVTGLY
jgi:hypothetical protein